MKRVLVIPNFTKSNTFAVLEKLCCSLKKNGLTPMLCSRFGCPENFSGMPLLSAEECIETADMVICIGGDGTIIDGAHLSAKYGIPVMGCNVGKLGYLAQVDPDEIDEAVKNISKGDFSIQPRTGIIARCGQMGEKPTEENTIINFALNEVAVYNSERGRIANFEVYCNGKLVKSLAADGVIISTPTGSTAYALSAGGPVIDPVLETLSLTYICPHNLSLRPIVFSADYSLAVKSSTCAMLVTADGRKKMEIPQGEYLLIERSPQKANFIHFSEDEFFQVLAEKMK